MFCMKCGKELQDDAVFCPFCGYKSGARTENVERQVGYININDFQENYRRMSRPEPSQTPTIMMILAVIGGAMCVLGVFLPYISASALGSHMEKTFKELAVQDYIIFVAVGAISIALSLFKKFIGTVLTGIIYMVCYYIDTTDYWETIRNESGGVFVSKGIGLYCMIGGAIAVILFGIIGFATKLQNKA